MSKNVTNNPDGTYRYNNDPNLYYKGKKLCQSRTCQSAPVNERPEVKYRNLRLCKECGDMHKKHIKAAKMRKHRRRARLLRDNTTSTTYTLRVVIPSSENKERYRDNIGNIMKLSAEHISSRISNGCAGVGTGGGGKTFTVEWKNGRIRSNE